MSVLPVPPQPLGASGRMTQYVRIFLGTKELTGTYWTLPVDGQTTAQDEKVAAQTEATSTTTTTQGEKVWRTMEELEGHASVWNLCTEIRDDKQEANVRFAVFEREGRKVVMSRSITLSEEQVKVFDVTGRGEALATHEKQVKRTKDGAQHSGNWKPRIPRKGEVLYSKQFSADVSKLKSKRKFLERIAVFKSFHRDLQEETFVYKTQNDQNKGRQDLLDVGNWLLQNLDASPYGDRNVFFGSILFIIKRQEFNVCDMQFDVNQKPQFSGQTVITMLKYRKFLFDTQLYVQEKLQQPEPYPSLLSFCASILAINYFYIEGLAELLLQRCFNNERKAMAFEQHPGLEEYAMFVEEADKKETLAETRSSGLYLGRNNSSPSIAYFCTLKSLFVALAASASNSNMKKEVVKLGLQQTKLDSAWLQRMVEGRDFFHIFLLEWLAQIAYFIGSYKKIKWGLIPGYYTWVSILLQQMMEMPLVEWTEEFIQCTDSFLLNPKLLSIYIKITFSKTNAHTTEEVESTLRLIDGWIDLLPISVDEQSGVIEPLHETFDYDYFMKGLNILLRSDHFVVLLETLLLLYNHMDRFVGVYRVQMIDDFLLSPEIFSRLFMSWNHHVRHVYHLLLIYKLARFPQNEPTPVGDAIAEYGTVDAQNRSKVSDGPRGRRGLEGIRGGSDDEKEKKNGDGDGDNSDESDDALFDMPLPDPEKHQSLRKMSQHSLMSDERSGMSSPVHVDETIADEDDVEEVLPPTLPQPPTSESTTSTTSTTTTTTTTRKASSGEIALTMSPPPTPSPPSSAPPEPVAECSRMILPPMVDEDNVVEIIAGSECVVKLELRTRSNESVPLTRQVSAKLVGDDGTRNLRITQVGDGGVGTYRVSCRPSHGGEYKLYLQVGGVDVRGSPLSVVAVEKRSKLSSTSSSQASDNDSLGASREDRDRDRDRHSSRSNRSSPSSSPNNPRKSSRKSERSHRDRDKDKDKDKDDKHRRHRDRESKRSPKLNTSSGDVRSSSRESSRSRGARSRSASASSKSGEKAAPYPFFGMTNAPRLENATRYQTHFVVNDEREIDQHLQKKAQYLLASVRRQLRSKLLCDVSKEHAIYAQNSFDEMNKVLEEFEEFKRGADFDELLTCRVCPPLDQDAIMERDFNLHTASFTAKANEANRSLYGDNAPVLSVPTLDDLEEEDLEDDEEMEMDMGGV